MKSVETTMSERAQHFLQSIQDVSVHIENPVAFATNVMLNHVRLTDTALESAGSQLNDLVLNMMHYVAETTTTLTQVYQSRDAKQISCNVLAEMKKLMADETEPLGVLLNGVAGLIQQIAGDDINNYLEFKTFDFAEELNASY